MTAKVNLLPRAARAETAKLQQRGAAVGVVVIVLAALGIATWVQAGVLSDAEDELADARAELSAAQADVAALAEFEDLERLISDTDTLLTATMGNEVTLAGLLQDVALVTPVEGAFTSMGVEFTGEDGLNVGTFTGNAEVESSHAPGVERFLLQLERPAGFRNVFPGASSIDEDDIANFSVTVQLGPEYRTDRYQGGLPEVVR